MRSPSAPTTTSCHCSLLSRVWKQALLGFSHYEGPPFLAAVAAAQAPLHCPGRRRPGARRLLHPPAPRLPPRSPPPRYLASDLFCTLPTCCSPHLLLVFFFLTVSRAWIGGARRGCHQHCTISSTHFFPLLLNFIHATFRNYLFFSHSSDARVSF